MAQLISSFFQALEHFFLWLKEYINLKYISFLTAILSGFESSPSSQGFEYKRKICSR